MSDYDLALDIDPNNFIGHYNRGLLRARVGDDNRAIEDFDFVIKMEPDNMMAVFNRGLLRAQTGDYRGAIQDYTTVINQYPNFLAGYYQRSEARRKIGDKKGAEQDEFKVMKAQIDKQNGVTNKDVAQNKDKENEEEGGEKTRKKSDKNMNNYRKIVIADDSEAEQRYTSDYRGRVQDKNVNITLEPMFALTYYEKMSDVKRSVNFHKYIEDLNRTGILPKRLRITNMEAPLTEEQVKVHFALIDTHTSAIVEDDKNASKRFARAIDFYLVQDFSSAVSDLTQTILLAGDFFPAYFMRALIRCKQLEYQKAEQAVETDVVPVFLAAVAFSLVIMLPSVVGCLICSLLPAISGWILFVEQHAWSRKHQASVLPIDFDLKSFAWRIGVCACLVGVADGMVRAAFLSSNNLSIHVFLQWPLAGAGLLTMVIVYGAALLSSEQSTRTIYKAAICVMAFFFMLLPVFTSAQDVESVLALAGYGTFNVLIWMLLAEISSNYRLSSTEVIGIGCGMVTLGVLLGSIAGNIVDRFAPFTPQFLSLIALIATMAVLLSFLFVFRESDLIALTEEPESEAESAEDRALASSSDVPPAASDNPRPRFQDRCLEVAAAFELSPKETEVMILFAKGRSAARIQEELFISKGTVSTHLRHIYQKMDVHSKQEMLDVIEGVIRE